MKQLKNYFFYGMILILILTACLFSYIHRDFAQAAPNQSGNLKHAQELLKKAIAVPEGNPVVGIGRGTDYAKVTMEAINNVGGLQSIIKKGDTVLIKPNICTFAEAGAPTITDYRTVQAIVNMVRQLGAAKIIIAEGTISGNSFDSLGLKANKYDTIKGVQLVNLNAINEEGCYKLKPLKSLTGSEFFIPKVFMDADVYINVAKLKTHFQTDAVVSLSMKNSFGIPPGAIYGIAYKGGLHVLGLKEAIIDLNRIRKPDISIIEGIIGGEGYGPLYNTPVKSNIVFAGKDVAALDTVASTFMGFKVADIPHLDLAGKEKVGITDLSKIKIVGADLNKIKMKFKR